MYLAVGRERLVSGVVNGLYSVEAVLVFQTLGFKTEAINMPVKII